MSEDDEKKPELVFEWVSAPPPARVAQPNPILPADVFSPDLEHGSGRTLHDWQGDERASIPLESDAPRPPLVARASFPPPVRSPSDPSLPRPRPSNEPRTRAAHAVPEVIATEQRHTDAPSPFAFGGRIGRVRFLMRGLLAPCIVVLCAPLLALIDPWLYTVGAFISVAIALMLSVSATIARLHDVNLSGGFVILPVVANALSVVASPRSSRAMLVVSGVLALLASLMTLALLLVPGDVGDNDHGTPIAPDSSTYRIGAVVCVLALCVAVVAAMKLGVPSVNLPS